MAPPRALVIVGAGGQGREALDTVEALNDPQVRATGAFEPIDHPTYGTFDTVASPFRMRTATSKVRGPAPGVGQHTAEVLAEVGMDPADIEALS